MSLDRRKLDIVREEGSCIYARCPACAELGHDRKKEHLIIYENGSYNCIKYGPDELHNRRIWQIAGLNSKGGGIAAISRPRVANQRADLKVVRQLPKLLRLQWLECKRICLTRGWSLDTMPALFELSDRGLLCTAELWDKEFWHDAWVIYDLTFRGLQAKKLYGKDWGCGKVKTLAGSSSKWTIGAAKIEQRPIVVLCEGMPDFVAVLGVAEFERVPLADIAPVCVAGAGNCIHSDALPHFTKKRVRIIAHPDEAGQKAARGWAKQLRSVEAKVSLFTFGDVVRKDGKLVKDLADYLTLLDGECDPSHFVLRDLWQEYISGEIDRWIP